MINWHEAQVEEKARKLHHFHRRQYILLHFNVLRAIVKCSKFDLITSKPYPETSNIGWFRLIKTNKLENILYDFAYRFASFGYGYAYVQCLQNEKLNRFDINNISSSYRSFQFE